MTGTFRRLAVGGLPEDEFLELWETVNERVVPGIEKTGLLLCPHEPVVIKPMVWAALTIHALDLGYSRKHIELWLNAVLDTWEQMRRERSNDADS